MNLGAIIRRVGELRKPDGDRLTSDIKDFINLAQREIAERYNWSFLKSHGDITIAAGSTSGALPDNFKQLTEEQSPISYSNATTTAGFPVPVQVYTREQMQNRGWWPLTQWNYGETTFLAQFGVYIDLDAGIPTINIPQTIQSSTAVTFTVSAYFYPDDLFKAVDHNSLTDHGTLSNALVKLAKALAYESEDETDKRAVAARAIYEADIIKSLYADKSKERGGRVLRM